MMLDDVSNQKQIEQTAIKNDTTFYSDQNKKDGNKVTEKNEPVEINEFDKLTIQNSYLIQVICKLSYPLLHGFKENVIRKYGVNMDLNHELEVAITDYNDKFVIPQHTASSLLFDGREPRKDVLVKLEKIAHEFIQSENFPMLYRRHTEQALKGVLENVDSRTYKKYFKCIKDFVEKTTGQKLGYYDVYNLSGFREAVQEKLSNIESKRKENKSC